MAERKDKRVRFNIDIENAIDKFIQEEQTLRQSPDPLSFNEAINMICWRYFKLAAKLKEINFPITI